ncbi:MAG: hypothetical protein ACYCX3_08190 [Thermoleophilia bacterium]
MCSTCGLPLEAATDAAVYPCRTCGRAFEVESDRLVELRPKTAAVTTDLAVPPAVRYLAVWRFLASVDVEGKQAKTGAPPTQVWDQIRRVAEPDPPFLYVPAFSLVRVVVQQLGLGLVQAQPQLELEAWLPPERPVPPRSVDHSDTAVGESWASDPGFGTLSPVLLSRADAEVVAHFVYLALESRSTPDLRSIDYELALTGGELLFLPAVHDVRHVRDSNWRFLLREFDGLVA